MKTIICLLFTSMLITCKKENKESPFASDSLDSQSHFVSNNQGATSLSVCNYELDEAALTSEGWTKTWEDNFSGGLDKWNIWVGGSYNYELQHYQAANLQMNNGILSIVAKRENVTGATLPSDPTSKSFEFTSGRIESKTNFSASSATPKVRIIARLKLASGTGMWPAFWSYGDPWPTHGEIDIMEARGTQPYNYETAFWYGRKAGVNTATNTGTTISSDVSLMDCWHVYELIWQKNSLTFLLDGNVVATKTGGVITNMYRKTQRVTLNLAIGGGFTGYPNSADVQTGIFEIDWVKVFTAQ